jgi:hypothetical protein
LLSHTHYTQPVDKNSRVALRYEVGRFFGAVERLKRAADARNTVETESAFSSMSVALDRYLKAGDLYEAYDPVTSTEKFYKGVDQSTLVFIPPARDPPKVCGASLLRSLYTLSRVTLFNAAQS